MKHPLRLFLPILIVILGSAIGVSAIGKEEPSVVSTTTTTVARAVTTTTLPTTVAPTTTTVVAISPLEFLSFALAIPADVPCLEWAGVAHLAGWPVALLPEILTIAYRESRCRNVIFGHPDWNGSDSGPLQINKVWLDEIESKYGHQGYVNMPFYNFAWAWEMYVWFDVHRGCGFAPWYKTYSCK